MAGRCGFLATLLITGLACAGIEAAPTGPAQPRPPVGVPQIDLTAVPAFARSGFDADWMRPQGTGPGPKWQRIAPALDGRRSLRVADLGISSRPPRRFLSPRSAARDSFSFLMAVDLPPNVTHGRAPLALLLAHIGETWEIYLNGNLIRRSAPGRSGVERGLLTYLPRHLLRPGRNWLGFHIRGDPSFPFTGFYRASPYMIGDYRQLAKLHSDRAEVALIFLYLFAGLFHLLLFVRRPSERSNLYFGLFAVGIFCYFLVRTTLLYDLGLDFGILRRAELVALFALVPLCASLFDVLIHGAPGRVSRGAWIFHGLLGAAVIGGPLPMTHDLARIWQVAALLFFFPYIVLAQVGKPWWRMVRIAHATEGRWTGAMWQATWRTPPGNLLLGMIILLICSIYDIVDSFWLALGYRTTQYGFVLFVVGMMLILANRFSSTHQRVEQLHTDLDETARRLRLSEQRYGVLIESSSEMVFTLDTSRNILSANQAFRRALGSAWRQDRLVNLDELTEIGDEAGRHEMELLRDKLHELEQSRFPVDLRTRFRLGERAEPVELAVRLEQVGGVEDGQREVLVRAWPVGEDSLLKYVVSERLHYSITNNLTTCDEVSRRLVRNVERYMDEEEVGHIRIALREILFNAVEHGNLGITYEDKTREMQNHNYHEYVARLQVDERFSSRRVNIEYALDAEKVEYVVTDEGPGFDFKAMDERIAVDVADANLPHGRGIFMTRYVFDEVEYIGRGNVVRLAKYLQQPAAATGPDRMTNPAPK